MPINKIYRAPFESDEMYHVYNRCVQGQKLFYSNENYEFFMELFEVYLADLMKIYAWSLIPNHFHWLLSVKEFETCKFSIKDEELLFNKGKSLDDLIRRRCKNLFLCYSMNLKKTEGIKTNVFSQKFRSKKVTDSKQLTQLYYYIHQNPLHYGITNDWANYEWSSFKEIVQQPYSLLERQFAFDWFGSKAAFINMHRLNIADFEGIHDF
jgi:hypothetical protein